MILLPGKETFEVQSLYRYAKPNKTTSATDYSYDPNKSMNVDNNKDISHIHYNYLNLPGSIVWQANKLQMSLGVYGVIVKVFLVQRNCRI